MSRRAVFAIPGDLHRKSGGTLYDRRMVSELCDLGWRVEIVGLPRGYPAPTPEERRQAARAFAALGNGACVLVDGLALGAMPEIAEREADRLNLVALVHHPLASETGLSQDLRRGLQASEREALRHVSAVIVTSPATARELASNYAVESDRIVVAVPGTDPAPARATRAAEHTPMILSVGAITPRKDHATLVAALSMLDDLAWSCRIVGDDQADPDCAAALGRQIAEIELSDRMTVTGPLDDVSGEYVAADIFALASRYEGYGMVFAEAMAHGLPIVGCRGGAIADVVPKTAGILVEPGDVAGFAASLRRLIEAEDTYRSFAAGSREAGRCLPTWAQSAGKIARALDQAVGGLESSRDKACAS